MMPLSHIHRKCAAGYTITKLQQKINYLMYMDDIKLFTKNEKELETVIQAVRIYSQDIGMEFGIEKDTMLIMRKWETTHNGENKVSKVGDRSRSRPEGSLFNSYYTKV